jgi:hypothetical protein
MSHDYTYSFSHPTFYKIVQLSSHMLLSVKCVLINPCISLGKLLVQIWKTKLYYAYFLENSKCGHQSPQVGGD